MPVISLPTLELYYESHGAEESPPVVLLHGATETFSIGWRKQVRGLSDRFHIIGPDLRGHGHSSNPAARLDLRQMADDIADLLDALEVRSAHVCGFSGGGSTALFMALRHRSRLRSLTLISNNMERDAARRDAGFWDPSIVAERNPHWLKAMAGWHEVPPAQLLGWWAEEDAHRPDFKAADLRGITVQAMVVAGDRDPIVPLEQSLRLFRALPRSQLLVLPDTGHGAPHRSPRLLNEALAAFWTSIEAERRRGSPTMA